MDPAPLSIDSISLFFRYALSLTAWKRVHNTTWSLRANPSSGNLHPTEGYALLPALSAIHDRSGVYHYAPKEHALERRADLAPSVWAALIFRRVPSSWDCRPFTGGRRGSTVSVRSVHQHDVGHALGTMRFAAAALGWTLCFLDRAGDAAVSELLGLDRDADYAGAEREHRTLGARRAGRLGQAPRPAAAGRWRRQVGAARWCGMANALSAEHGVDWPVIDQVARATTNTTMAIDEDFSASLPRENSSSRQFG